MALPPPGVLVLASSGRVPARRAPNSGLAPGKVRQDEAGDGRRPGRTSTYKSCSQQPGQHLLLSVGKRLLSSVEVVLPCLRVPDFDAGVRTDDDAVLGEPCVLAQRLR